MSSQHLVTMKPDFFSEMKKLPPKEAIQIYNKIFSLTQDPRPDAKTKKQLKYLDGGRHLHRLRSGYYRIFYTFDNQYISILTVRRRDDDTYEDAIDEEFLGGLSVDPLAEYQSGYTARSVPSTDWTHFTQTQSNSTPLPTPITIAMLQKLEVPEKFYTPLLSIQTEEQLLENSHVDANILTNVIDYLFPKPMSAVLKQPDLESVSVADFIKYHDGELIPFLLKLSPEQYQLVHRFQHVHGPTLVKGGPGTGKSTVALYRTKALIEKLLESGVTKPRILFTTYTNALVNSSRQLLHYLLGPHAAYVEVATADRIIRRVLSKQQAEREIISDIELQQLFQVAAEKPKLEGNILQQQLQLSMLEKMGLDYLQQEIHDIIEARQLRTLDAYLATSRSGRRIRLNAVHRKAIWSIYERFMELVQASGKETWQISRTRAVELVEQSRYHRYYDAVIIDEAQDLDPTALRFLVKLCKSPEHLFVAADANQSIYGNGFNWQDVHEDLNFKGRTGLLYTNYRSTQEIGRAATAYLRTEESLLDDEYSHHLYAHTGPIPVLYTLASPTEEAAILGQFFKRATKEIHHPLASCALLCPNEQIGSALAQSLRECNIDARFMKSNELNLDYSGIKVLTLNAAKGLEFPIVALAGFAESSYASLQSHAGRSQEEIDERLARARRTLFVGMTRAMRTLLVVLPAHIDSPLLQGFVKRDWLMLPQS